MSNKIQNEMAKRRYRLKARARRRDEVHLRITEAAVQLHEKLGPAQTTVSDIARLAGVQRATVYNHFPTDLELFDTCSTHWFSKNPPPNESSWCGVRDSYDRTRTILSEFYGYYRRSERMLENVLRDRSLVPPLAEILRRKWDPMLEEIAQLLSTTWSVSVLQPGHHEPSRVERRLTNRAIFQATVRVGLDFFTWQILATSGLSDETAARLSADWIRLCARERFSC